VIARPTAAAPRPYRFPDFERHRLANGLTVWLVPLPDRELVSIHLLTDAGAAAEEEERGGLAALTAQVLVTGTERLDAAAFAETTERLGIDVSSESSWDSARAGFVALGEHLGAGLALLAEMIRSPRLDEGEFERLRSERMNDILQARADPGRLADEAFLRELFDAGVPYRRLSAGGPETVERLTVADAREFHATRYAPTAAHLVIAGAFDPPAALAAIEAQLGDWSGTGAGHREFEARARAGRRVVLVDRPGSVQSELRVGHLGIDRHDARYFPATVMAALLGGVFGSRINLRLREELGYTYGARSAFDPRRAAGPFTASAAVQTEVTADAIRELLAQLERIREAPPGEQELAEVRDFLVGVFPLRFETTAGIAAAIEPLAVYGLPDDYWQSYRERVESVGTADVHRVARELVRPDDALILLTGDAARVRDELERAELGPLEVIPAP
jgi:zinc protease